MTPQAFNRALGAVIRSERKARGWSMEDLAKLLGFSYQQVGKYEYGQNGCSAQLVMKLADIFQLSVFDLYERAGIKMKTPEPSVADNDAFLASRYVRKIKDEKLRQAVIEFTRKLAYEGANR